MKISQTVWKIIALVLLAAVAATVSLLYVFVLKPKPVEGEKTVNFAIVANKGDLKRIERYQIRTAQRNYGELLFVLNDKLDLKLDNEDLMAGYFTSALGYDSHFANNGEFFTVLTDYAPALNTADEYFNWKTLNGVKVGMANFGIKDIPLAEGNTYLMALVDNSTPAEAAFTIESPVVKLTDDTVAVYEGKLAEANNVLIPVVVITGAAILAIAGLVVVEYVRAKKSK